MARKSAKAPTFAAKTADSLARQRAAIGVLKSTGRPGGGGMGTGERTNLAAPHSRGPAWMSGIEQVLRASSKPVSRGRTVSKKGK